MASNNLNGKTTIIRRFTTKLNPPSQADFLIELRKEVNI